MFFSTMPNDQPDTRSSLANSSEVWIYEGRVYIGHKLYAYVCVCALITTGFGKPGSVLTLLPVLCKSQLSEGKCFVQTSDCHSAFHTQEDIKMMHFVPIAGRVF